MDYVKFLFGCGETFMNDKRRYFYYKQSTLVAELLRASNHKHLKDTANAPITLRHK